MDGATSKVGTSDAEHRRRVWLLWICVGGTMVFVGIIWLVQLRVNRVFAGNTANAKSNIERDFLDLEQKIRTGLPTRIPKQYDASVRDSIVKKLSEQLQVGPVFGPTNPASMRP